MTTPTHYNERAYGSAYREDFWAMSPNGLNTAADFVEGLCVWVKEEGPKAGTTYRAYIRDTAAALERAAAVAEQPTGNAYKHTANQLTELSRDAGRTEPKAVTANSLFGLFTALRAQALTAHRENTERAERHDREQLEQRQAEHNTENRRQAERADRYHASRYTDNRPTT